jgi:hypothetical protein
MQLECLQLYDLFLLTSKALSVLHCKIDLSQHISYVDFYATQLSILQNYFTVPKMQTVFRIEGRFGFSLVLARENLLMVQVEQEGVKL